MSKPNLLLIGAGGHSISCIDVVEQENKYQIIGLVGSPNEVGRHILGYEVLGNDDLLPQLHELAEFALISVGQIGINEIRSVLFARTANLGFKMPVVVSPKAYVSRHAAIGSGTVVMHNATINAGAKIGENCIINSHSLIEHDTVVEDNCHIATSATINGGSTVGRSSFVGSGCTIRESVTVGQRCTIGAGVTLRHDLPSDSRFLGERNL